MLGDVFGLTGHRNNDFLVIIADDIQELVSLHGEDDALELASVFDDVGDSLCLQVKVGRVMGPGTFDIRIATKSHRISGSCRHDTVRGLSVYVVVAHRLDFDF